jgi:predicted nucleic acid-binding protein
VTRLLVDTGPMVALHDARDPDHARCCEVIAARRGVLCTTWPAVTECMYLLGGSASSQAKLLELIDTGRLEITEIGDVVTRIADLMIKYRNVPMDFTDATLVAVAERDHHTEVFTLDSDFRIYRVGRRALTVLP